VQSANSLRNAMDKQCVDKENFEQVQKRV
jgi:hypothetical protein